MTPTTPPSRLMGGGLAQRQPGGYVEQPMLTSGDDVGVILRILAPGADSYGAQDVVRHLTAQSEMSVEFQRP